MKCNTTITDGLFWWLIKFCIDIFIRLKNSSSVSTLMHEHHITNCVLRPQFPTLFTDNFHTNLNADITERQPTEQ